MEFNNVFKIASIRSVMYNVNVRSEPRPTQPIPHFTEATYILLNQLRSKKPEIVDGEIKVKSRLMKANGTYFTDQEQEEYYELHEFFKWMSEREERERQERQEEERWDRWDVPLTDTWRFSK